MYLQHEQHHAWVVGVDSSFVNVASAGMFSLGWNTKVLMSVMETQLAPMMNLLSLKDQTPEMHIWNFPMESELQEE